MVYSGDTKKVLRKLIQDFDDFEYETFAFDAGIDPQNGMEMEEWIGQLSDIEANEYIDVITSCVDDKTKVNVGGYVEAMNSDMLDEAVNKLVETFKQWEDAPLTEPEMVEYAKKDLLKYIEYKLDRL